MTDRMLMLTLTRIEADHLRDLVGQFGDLVTGTPAEDDPAVERLTPDVYPDDPEAAGEFRSLTRADLLHRRAREAQIVRKALDGVLAEQPEASGDDSPEGDPDFGPVDIAVAEEAIDPWLRTLTALRLVIASRLGVTTEGDHDPDDPRFSVLDWLGYRLDGLVQAADSLREE
ncbi:DUF2017 family protein [Microbacterium halophytorum]|uniref:DUF2017 family protein n=1 Tax=Microbacterium halophytorum TaxID=2067568 RepID=UPI000CFC9B93|nr:DUF2017 family protein [Microbacterium halophytorum]